jgi:hypothetical protein
MITAATMRQHAENCLAMAEQATTEPVRRRHMRMAVAWQDLSDRQEWLDRELEQVTPATPARSALNGFMHS